MKQIKSKNSYIYFLLFPLFLFFARDAHASTLYLVPQSQTVYKGDTFIADVRLDTEGEEINALDVTLNFPADRLEALDFSKGNSIINFWVHEPSLAVGKINIVGGRPGGFKGDGLIGRITFLSKKTGRASVVFQADSKILLNDGKGTEDKVGFLSVDYEIVDKPQNLPEVSSSSHPDQNQWYKANSLYLHWNLIEGAQYSYLLSEDPLASPDFVPDKPAGELIWMGDIKYEGLEDGIYYFSLIQKLPGKNWSEKISCRSMIDSTLPEEFTPKIGQDPALFGGKKFLSFASTDQASGIDHYEIKENGIWKIGQSPYVLEDQSLSNKISVKAVDKAGNERIAEYIPPAVPQKISPYLIIALALAILGFLGLKLLKKRK